MESCFSQNRTELDTDEHMSFSHKPRYNGLINQGTTCYLNTVLQCLYMTKEFRKEVESFKKGQQDSSQETNDLLQELEKLFEQLKKDAGRTEGITKTLHISNVYEQQDAVEYYQVVLKAVGQTSKMFKETLCNNSKCVSGHIFQQRFVKEDGHDEMYNVWIDIEEFPTILTLYLKRFDFDYIKYVKNNRPVDIPLSLNIKGNGYDLYAVINHKGDRNGGHYNAVIKPYEENQWYCFDDSSVLQVSGGLLTDVPKKVTPKLLFYTHKKKISNFLPAVKDSEDTDVTSKWQYLKRETTSSPSNTEIMPSVTKEVSQNRKSELNTDEHMSFSHKPRYNGLINQGTTCYLNTVLQCLYMTKEFRKEVESFKKGQQDSSQETNDLLQELEKLFEQLKKDAGRTEGITKTLHISNVHEQQDAVEYYQVVLKAVGQTSKVFEGTLSNNSKCVNGHIFQQTSSFITVPLAMEDGHDEIYNVEEGLNAFFKHSTLDEDNWLYCDECDQKTESDTWIDIEEFPTILTLHLKRFDFDYMHMEYVKNNRPVDIPHSLYIKDNGYDLYAVINHKGDRKGGHYNAVIKPSEETQWYCFDDSFVMQFYQEYEQLFKSRVAYLLMYRKRSHPEPTTEAANKGN